MITIIFVVMMIPMALIIDDCCGARLVVVRFPDPPDVNCYLDDKATKGANWVHTRQNAVRQTSDNFDDDYDNKDDDYNKDDDEDNNDDNSDGEIDEDDLRSKVGMQGMMHPRRQQMIPGFSKP